MMLLFEASKKNEQRCVCIDVYIMLTTITVMLYGLKYTKITGNFTVCSTLLETKKTSKLRIILPFESTRALIQYKYVILPV